MKVNSIRVSIPDKPFLFWNNNSSESIIVAVVFIFLLFAIFFSIMVFRANIAIVMAMVISL